MRQATKTGIGAAALIALSFVVIDEPAARDAITRGIDASVAATERATQLPTARDDALAEVGTTQVAIAPRSRRGRRPPIINQQTVVLALPGMTELTDTLPMQRLSRPGVAARADDARTCILDRLGAGADGATTDIVVRLCLAQFDVGARDIGLR